MPVKTPRFHVRLGDKRTTVSIDRTLTELMALKLGEQPYSEEAHQAIRLCRTGSMRQTIRGGIKSVNGCSLTLFTR